MLTPAPARVFFTVPGRISGKGRPRFVKATGRTFTPEKTRSMEAVLRTIGSDTMAGRLPFDRAVCLSVRAVFTPPKSWGVRKRAEAKHVTGRPDLDNVAKLIGDALNGIVWTDDAMISALTIQRVYSLTEPEHVEISVQPLLSLAELAPQTAGREAA